MNKDTDIENGHAERKGGRRREEVGGVRKSIIDMIILLCVKQIESGKLLCCQGSSALCSVET